MAGRWLTKAETHRLQQIATSQERDIFLKRLAKTLRKSQRKPSPKRKQPARPALTETDAQIEARLWKQ